MSKKSKRDFSSIGSKILENKERPNSLAEIIQDTPKKNELNDNNVEAQPKKPTVREKQSKINTNTIVKDGIAIPSDDYDLIDNMIVRCMKEGQKATKSDIYRASLRYLNSSSDNVLLKLILQVRKDKKTHS